MDFPLRRFFFHRNAALRLLFLRPLYASLALRERPRVFREARRAVRFLALYSSANGPDCNDVDEKRSG